MGKFDVYRQIDSLVNIEFGRGTRSLFKAVQFKPECIACANLIRDIVPGCAVVTTGFPIMPEGRPETDGPPGAAVLARALAMLGWKVVLVADEWNARAFGKIFSALGIHHVSESVSADKIAKEECDNIYEKYAPSLGVSIERPGKGAAGRYYSMRGLDITDRTGKVSFLFEKLMREGGRTFGIGDGGNELGMGLIRSNEVMGNIPNGRKIFSVEKADVLMTASVSNWGAYAVVAALSLLEKRNFMHTSKEEAKLIRACIDNGCVDGVLNKPECSVDGLPCDANQGIVALLGAIVRQRNASFFDEE